MKKAIILGANGFLGKNLTHYLVKMGVEVCAMVQVHSNYEDIKHLQNVEIIEFELDSIQQYENIISKDYDVLYHLAWVGVSSKFKNDIEIQTQNLHFLDAVFHFAHSIGVKKMVCPGTASEYGCSQEVITGNNMPSPSDAYSTIKLEYHQKGTQKAKELGIEFIWTLISTAYGPDRKDNNLIHYTITSLLAGETPKYTRLEQQWDYIFIDDLIHAFYLLGEHGTGGKVYPIGYGKSRPLLEYVNQIKKLINPDAKLEIGVLPYKNGTIDNQIIDISELIKDTGFKPQFDFHEGIKRTIEVYYKQTKTTKMLQNKKREEILELVKEYYQLSFGDPKTYERGDRISYGGRFFNEEEMVNLVDASLDFWLTTGRYAQDFEKDFAKWIGVRYCLLTNSGSSANLLAFMALTSPLLKERAIQRGDEVITVAAGFPTTIAPIIQYGAIPVFVDVTIPEYNIDCNQLEKALSPKTKAVMIAHTMGNPFDLNFIRSFCDQHQLWLIEDNCDALGSQYYYQNNWHYTGSIGDINTSSFYPPHHITMGEGGAVYTNNPLLSRIVASFRDWGRDCYCPSGIDNSCKHRFTQKHGDLPLGYDHKYVYSHFGYNLKVTDMQAAVGYAQLKKLPGFISARQNNWTYLKDHLQELDRFFILPEPSLHTNPSWFGFLITLKKDTPFSRLDLIQHLEEHNIQTRLLFAGNLLKHPCFNEMRASGEGFRVVGDLTNTDMILERTFWIGVYPGMSNEMLQYMVDTIKEFVLQFE